MNDEFDGPWKEILDVLLEEFMSFFHPDLHARIDWSRGYVSLEQELLRITPQGEGDSQTVDKLFRVWERTGEERWLLIHIEIQSQSREPFARRMFVYNVSIFLGFERMPISLAVLADERKDWRPTNFRMEDAGTRHDFTFRSVKLLDFLGREEELRTSTNPFAVIVDAHLSTQKTRGDKAERGEIKFAITRSLFQRGFSRERIQMIFRFMDWLMKLPPEINQIWWQKVRILEKENEMPFVDIWEQERRDLTAKLREDLAQEIRKELVQEVRKEVAQEVRKEVAQEVRKEVAQEVRKEVAQEVRKEVVQEVRKEVAQEGLRDSIVRHLNLRFGSAGKQLAPRLKLIDSDEKLFEISDLLVLGNSLEEIESRLSQEGSDSSAALPEPQG